MARGNEIDSHSSCLFSKTAVRNISTVLVVHGNISTGTFVREHIGTKVNRPKNTSFQIRQPESDARKSIPGNDYSPSQKEREAAMLITDFRMIRLRSLSLISCKKLISIFRTSALMSFRKLSVELSFPKSSISTRKPF